MTNAMHLEDIGPAIALPFRDEAEAEGELQWIHPTCHIDSPVWTVVDEDVLGLVCARCMRSVARLYLRRRPAAVAPG